MVYPPLPHLFDQTSVFLSLQEVHDEIIQAYHRIKKVKAEWGQRVSLVRTPLLDSLH